MSSTNKTDVASRNTASYRHRKRAQGVCIYGGCWVKTDRVYCTIHAQRSAILQRIRHESRETHPCIVCGAPAHKTYCSPKCAASQQIHWLTLKCAWCGTNFPRRASAHHGNIKKKKTTNNFHSRQCAGLWIQHVYMKQPGMIKEEVLSVKA